MIECRVAETHAHWKTCINFDFYEEMGPRDMIDNLPPLPSWHGENFRVLLNVC